jgi:hypothetical protein
MEDAKTIDQARRANDARKALKEFKNRHGQDLYKGTDARSTATLMDNKKKAFLKQSLEQRKKDQAERPKGEGRSFGDKAMMKI